MLGEAHIPTKSKKLERVVYTAQGKRCGAYKRKDMLFD